MAELAAEDSARSASRSHGRSSRRWLTIGAFLLPALALYLVFVLLPVVQAVYFSGYDWNGLRPMTDFVGTANFERALADDTFTGAIAHNALIVVLSLAFQLPFALGLALILNGRLRGRGLLRLLFFAP